MRTAVLLDDSDVKLGKVAVQETTFVIRHGGSYFVRTAEGVRLTRAGCGVGVVFRETQIFIRERLEPI